MGNKSTGRITGKLPASRNGNGVSNGVNKTASNFAQQKQELFALLDQNLTEKQTEFLLDLVKNYKNPLEMLLENGSMIKRMLK